MVIIDQESYHCQQRKICIYYIVALSLVHLVVHGEVGELVLQRLLLLAKVDVHCLVLGELLQANALLLRVEPVQLD